jgi:hypothetical protein
MIFIPDRRKVGTFAGMTRSFHAQSVRELHDLFLLVLFERLPDFHPQINLSGVFVRASVKHSNVSSGRLPLGDQFPGSRFPAPKSIELSGFPAWPMIAN